MAERGFTLDVTALPLCQFLSRLFIAQPDAALLQSCLDGPGARLLAGWAADPALAPAAGALVAALHAHDLPALNRAWTLLFTGAGGPGGVPPYASAHTESRLYGAAAARMQAELTRLEMSVAADCHEPPDHVAIELAVLAELLWREAPAEAEAFRRTELAWLPAFCRGCEAADPTGFYAASARLLAVLAGCPTLAAIPGDTPPC